MLVVIGIIVVVVGLAAPMITRAWRAGDRAATFSDLQAIATALEAYKQDHGDYPRIVERLPFTGGPDDYTGARMLCRALIGPGPGSATGTPPPAMIIDGAGVAPTAGAQETLPGPGFRIRGTQGKVYGPYLPLNRFKMANPTSTTAPTQPGYLALMDRYGKPILYYPANGKPNITLGTSFIMTFNPSTAGPRSLYNSDDNRAAMPLNVFRRMMGDANANGHIDPEETAAYDGAFLLWSTGPDEAFGNAATTATLGKTDDITNFRQ
jgi:type II secretory pathway pseudopilin PulG